MNTHAAKTQKIKSRSMSDEASLKQSRSDLSFQFVDNRPETIAQRKLRMLADNSPQSKQLGALQEMADKGPQTKQAAQLQAAIDYFSTQQHPIQKKENRAGLPNNLKNGIENLSGCTMDDVKVHYNSDKPAELQAYAYAQGRDIHIAPGQEKHLPHEAWHVAQQKQGRVKTMSRLKGAAINDDEHLEKEADLMGAAAASFDSPSAETVEEQVKPPTPSVTNSAPIQGRWMEMLGNLLKPQEKVFVHEKLTEDPILGFQIFLQFLEMKDEADFIQDSVIGNEVLETVIRKELNARFHLDSVIFSTGELIEFVKETVLIFNKLAIEGEGETAEVAEVDDSDHGSDAMGAPEQLIDWSEITQQGFQRADKRKDDSGNPLLYRIFLNLAEYHIQRAGARMPDRLPERFNAWFYGGVKTRAEFKEIIGLEQSQGDDSNHIIQLARSGNTFSLNGNYTGTSNSFKYENVVYYRDKDGNIDFRVNPTTIAADFNKQSTNKINTASIKWKYPQADVSEVQMSYDLSNKEEGIMPSGKKVPLKTATRPQHFAIADGLYPNNRKGTWTWHHLTPKYKMVLVDMRVHAKHGHNGGVHIWNK